MVGRNKGRGGGTDPGRDNALREREREERARQRAERAAAEAEQQAARAAKRETAPTSSREWSDGEWSSSGRPSAAPATESFAAPATRAGRERQRAFSPLAPAAPAVAAPAGDERAEKPRREREPGARKVKRSERSRAEEAPRDQKAPRASRASGGAAAAAGLLGSTSAFIDARRIPFAIGGGALVIVAILVAIGGSGSGSKKASPASVEAAARAKAEAKWAKSPYGKPTAVVLPPKSRLVAFAGAPHAKALGILGTISFAAAEKKLKIQSAPYARPTRHVQRAYDLIATIADAYPGRSGKYRTRQPTAVIARYLRAARRDHATLILDVQPGQSNFVDELKPLERWLKEPDVQLALDPEWRMRPGVVPGTEIGYVSGGELQATLNRVATLIKVGHLPPKMVLVHRFTDGMIKNFDTVKVPAGIVGVISIDGVGARANKEATYNKIAPTLPKPWLPGFKLFYDEDKAKGGVMSGKQVMGLKPRPHVVLYE